MINNMLPFWTENFRIVNGQDHLSLQSISINLYGKLLPGMTNLTQRIRYYSIYPWILSNYVKRIGYNDRDTWRDFLRKSEFLYALLSNIDEQEYGIPGSRSANELLKISRNKLSFKSYADYKSNNSYWKNPFGAYGQYYSSSLRHLDIIFNGEENEIDYLGENGRKLAKIMNDTIPKEIADLFYKCINTCSVTRNELSILSELLSPSQMHKDSLEAKLLREIIFKQVIEENDNNRINTLKLLLNIIDQYNDKEPFHLDDIKFTLLLGYFGNGKIFTNEPYKDVAAYWKAYVISELTHYSLEVMFRAMLEIVYAKNGLSLDILFELIEEKIIGFKRHCKLFTKTNLRNISFAKMMSLLALEYRAKGKKWFTSQNSFHNIYVKIDDALSEDEYDEAFFYSIILFSKINYEYSNDESLSDVYKPDGILKGEFNDYNSYQILNNKILWNEINAKAGIEYIFRKLIINRHSKIALEKLRLEKINTFKFEIRGEQIYHIEDVDPTLTNPRINNALNFLADLGLYSKQKCEVTPLGRKYL